MKYISNYNGDAKEKKTLEAMEAELKSFENLNQALTVKERGSNDEFQDAREELIDVSSFSCHSL